MKYFAHKLCFLIAYVLHRSIIRGCYHQQRVRVRVRERLQAVLVLEVVFSSFHIVSDDTEFELTELCRKYRVRLLFLDFKSSILHKT